MLAYEGSETLPYVKQIKSNTMVMRMQHHIFSSHTGTID